MNGEAIAFCVTMRIRQSTNWTWLDNNNCEWKANYINLPGDKNSVEKLNYSKGITVQPIWEVSTIEHQEEREKEKIPLIRAMLSTL